MANIVLGLASSHTPQLDIPAESWPLLREKDETDPRLDYAQLLSHAPDLSAQLTPERMRANDELCQKALASLTAILRQVSPDVLVILGDDQHEQFHDDNMPMFCVYRGPTLPLGTHKGAGNGDPALAGMAKGWRAAARPESPLLRTEYPAHPELAERIIEEFIEEGFDISVSNHLREDIGVGHAFSFLYRRLLPDCEIPVVPIMLNTFYPPNQPSPRRCYALGQALRRAIAAWNRDQRVAVMASGGLSHVIIDEDLDRSVLDALLEKDDERLRSIPTERLNLGTSEIRNWIALGGAMEPMEMLLAQYIPAYRSPAGTGCGMGFAYWM